MTKIILILIAVILVLGAVVYFLIKSLKAKSKEIAGLTSRLEGARANVEQLSKYIDGVLKIKNDEKTISQKIKEAESDEEICKIIADIVAVNNNGLQNN